VCMPVGRTIGPTKRRIYYRAAISIRKKRVDAACARNKFSPSPQRPVPLPLEHVQNRHRVRSAAVIIPFAVKKIPIAYTFRERKHRSYKTEYCLKKKKRFYRSNSFQIRLDETAVTNCFAFTALPSTEIAAYFASPAPHVPVTFRNNRTLRAVFSLYSSP